MNEVFDRLALEFPAEWGTSSSLFAHAAEFRNDFESAFCKHILRSQPPFAGPPSLNLLEAQRPLAIHFARYQLGVTGSDLYTELVKALRSADAIGATTFGSLNYDTVFEQAALRAGFSVNWLVDEARSRLRADAAHQITGPSASTVRVAKLHGSSNFIAEFDTRTRAIAAAPGTYLETHFDALDPRALSGSGGLDQILLDGNMPVMSQISPEKEQLLATAQMTQIREIWRASVEKAQSVVIIGVAAREHDRHVWDPIQNTGVAMHYIGSSRDFARWSSVSPGRWQHLGERWETVGQVMAAL